MLNRNGPAVLAASAIRFLTSVAIGVHVVELGTMNAGDALRGAVIAAQEARRNGLPVSPYSSVGDQQLRRRFGLLRDFGEALEATDQLYLVFQPRVDLASGRCTGAETLLRWRHPILGEISPAEFIPIVEQTELVQQLTQWVLDNALDQLAQWRGAGRDLTLSLNVSASNLREVDLIQRIQLALLKRKLRPESIEMELTESAMMAEPEQALALLKEMASAGLAIAIDDFGTGHSSLAYLQQVPAGVVKIDQAFVRGLSARAETDVALTETMVELLHRLGRRVVAEGVEDDVTVDLLTCMGCEEAQGYGIAKPMPASAFLQWYDRRNAVADRQPSQGAG